MFNNIIIDFICLIHFKRLKILYLSINKGFKFCKKIMIMSINGKKNF